jgi:hypothetical protein
VDGLHGIDRTRLGAQGSQGFILTLSLLTVALLATAPIEGSTRALPNSGASVDSDLPLVADRPEQIPLAAEDPNAPPPEAAPSVGRQTLKFVLNKQPSKMLRPDGKEGGEAAPEEAGPRGTIWIQPVATLFVPLVSVFASLGGITHAWNTFSFGATVSFGRVNAVAEFGWARTTRVNVGTGFEFLSLVGAWAVVGVAIHTGDRALSGFFIEPRLHLGLMYDEDGIVSVAHDIQVGLNVGYQVVLAERIYLAFIIGGTIGGGTNQTNPLSGPFLFDVGVRQRSQVVVGANLHLFRIGLAF